MEAIVTLIVFAWMTAFYLLPSILAVYFKRRQKGPIIVINLTLGWTLLGWIGALAWACASDNHNPTPTS